MALIEMQIDPRTLNHNLDRLCNLVERVADALDRMAPQAVSTHTGEPKRATMHRPDDYARYEAWAGGLFEEGRAQEVMENAYEPRK